MRVGVFFDMDGTLVDSRADLATAVNLVRRHYQLEPHSVATVVSFVGDGMKNLAERSFRDLPESEQDNALELLRRFYAEHEVDRTTLYPGVADGLRRLKAAGAVLAVVTNKPTPNTVNILDKLGVAAEFDELVGAGGRFDIKPSPDGILYLLDKYRLEPGRCWMLGDNYTDLKAARGAGVKRGYAMWGFGDLKGEAYDAGFSDFSHFAAAVLAGE